jgi:hypothetical protein
MSTPPAERSDTTETVASLMAALAFAVASLGIVYKPVRVIPIAIVVALIALAMGGGRSARIAGIAVIWGGVCWVAGMTIAVLTERSLW